MNKKIKLPDITPDLFVSDDVAIVGSSSILLDKKEGQKIDAHEDVIRFNRAITKGFEKHTGNRTTLRVTNGHTYQGFKLPDSWEFCSVNLVLQCASAQTRGVLEHYWRDKLAIMALFCEVI